ncbi:MAG: hypothetical protein AAFX85_03190 [Pseudomonadota bacterium]
MAERRRFIAVAALAGASFLVALAVGFAIAQTGVSLDAPATLPADI